MATGFPHEQLDCYHLAKGIAQWLLTVRFPPKCGDLQDQGIRASQSIVLNIAEGAKGGRAGQCHFRNALGSAAELCAVLDLVAVPGAAEKQAELRRVGAMTRRLGGG